MPKIKDLKRLLKIEDLNKAIMELDDFICGCRFDELTEPQRHFYFNQELERAINMDGFYLYFWNSTGEFAMETIASLKMIAANHTWPILQKAIDQFPRSNVPKETVRRESLILQIEDVASEVWDKLDKEFFKYQDNLNQLNMNYIEKNASFF